jgi:type II secretory pathway component PulC
VSTSRSAARTAGRTGQAAASSRAFDLNTIVDAHLFGVAAVGNIDPSAAPATQMSLVLVGTIAQTDPEQGIAIIGESSANARVYMRR